MAPEATHQYYNGLLTSQEDWWLQERLPCFVQGGRQSTHSEHANSKAQPSLPRPHLPMGKAGVSFKRSKPCDITEHLPVNPSSKEAPAASVSGHAPSDAALPRHRCILGSTKDQERCGRVVRLDDFSDLLCPDVACVRQRVPSSVFPTAHTHKQRDTYSAKDRPFRQPSPRADDTLLSHHRRIPATTFAPPGSHRPPPPPPPPAPPYTLSSNGLLIPPPMQSTSPGRQTSPQMLSLIRTGTDTCCTHACGTQYGTQMQASSQAQPKQQQQGDVKGLHSQGGPAAPDRAGAGANAAVLRPKYEAVMQSAPQFGFGRSPRWPQELRGGEEESKGGAEEGGERARSRSPPLHEQTRGGQGKAKAKEDLDVVGAYKAVLPQKAAPTFSKTPRFPQPAAPHSQHQEQRQQQRQQSGQDEEGGPQHKRPRTAPATKVLTHGVQAAIDFVKGRHNPTVTFGGPSVKEQLLQERAQRKLQMEQQRTEQEHRMKQQRLEQEQRIEVERARAQSIGQERQEGKEVGHQQLLHESEWPLHQPPPPTPLPPLPQQQQEQQQADQASAVFARGGLVSPGHLQPDVGGGGTFQSMLARLEAARAAFLMEVESASALCGEPGDVAGAQAAPMEVEMDAATESAADSHTAAVGWEEGSETIAGRRAEDLGEAAHAQMRPAEQTVPHPEFNAAGVDACQVELAESVVLEAAASDPAALAGAFRAAAEAEAEQQQQQQQQEQPHGAHPSQQQQQHQEQEQPHVVHLSQQQQQEQEQPHVVHLSQQQQQQEQEQPHVVHLSQAHGAPAIPAHPGRQQAQTAKDSGPPGGPDDGDLGQDDSGGDESDDGSPGDRGSIKGSGGGAESGPDEEFAGNQEELQTAARIALERHLRVQQQLQAQQRPPNISQHYLRLRRSSSSSSHAPPQRSISAPRASMPNPSFALVHRRAPTPTFGPPPLVVPPQQKKRAASPTPPLGPSHDSGPSHTPNPPQTAAAAAAVPDSQHLLTDTTDTRRSLSAGPVLRRSFSGSTKAPSRDTSPGLGDSRRSLALRNKGNRKASSRDPSPGPGDYAVEDDRGLRGVVSTARRPPSVPFSAAPRMPASNAGSWKPSLQSLLAWRKSDVGGALDKLKTRPPSAKIMPPPPPKPPAWDRKHDWGSEALDESDLGDQWHWRGDIVEGPQSRRRPQVEIEIEGQEGEEGGEEGAREIGGPRRWRRGFLHGILDKRGLLDVRHSLVEPRARGTALMRPETSQPRVRPRDAELAAAAVRAYLHELSIDPWTVDRVAHPRHPAWPFPSSTRDAQRRMDEDDEAEGRRYLLEPNWVALKPRIQGFPAFAQFINARADNRLEVRLQQLKAPAVGAYDMEGAWEFIQRHVPQVCMRFAADRWRTRDVMEGLARGGDRAAYELSLAADAVIRLQPPAWSFAPLPYDKERLEEEARQRRERHGLKAGFGPMLSWDPEEGLALVKPRPPGALPFELQPARDDGAAQAKRTRHLGPGTYDVRHDVVERQGPAFDFSRHQGHGILPSSSDEDEGEQPLPEGAILSLDVLPAKDAVLKRPRFPVHMGAMQGRDDEPQSPSKYGAYTNHLGLPDPDLDLVKAGRHRVQQVLMDIGPGHESLAPPSSPEAAKRGPGAYDLEGHNTLGNTGPAFDFGRAVGHDPVSPKANKDPLEGNRLSLDSPGAVDRVRPRARAALFLPEGAGGEAAAARRQLAGSDGCLDPRAYQDAMYEPDYDQVRPVAPRPLRFSLQVGRPQPKARPDTWALDYKAEDVPLSVLAGYPGVRKVPDFAAMQPHKPMGPTRPKLEGDRLDLDPMTALDTTKAQPRGIPAMDTQAEGHMDPTRMGTGAPPEQSEWLNYNPRFTLVKASTSPAPNMGRGLDREAAQKADPRAGEDVTGDLDGGVYNVKHGQVWASPRAVDFQRGQPHGSPTQNRTDPDEGNVLWLDPKLPQIGWSPEPSIPHTKQPMGKAPERWSADPVILDDGNVLKLRLSLDDLSHLRDRPTKVNAPVTAFGAMRANRYEQVLKPNENLAIPGVLQPKFTNQTMEATLAMEPRHDQVFEVFRKAPHSPAAEALRRADRVMARFQRGQLEQHLQRQEQQKWQLPMQDQDQNYGQRCGHDFGLQAGHEQDQLHELERQQPQQQQHLQPGMVRQLRRRAQRQLEQLQARAGKDERQQQQLPQQPYVQPSQHHQQQQQQQQERLPQQPGSQPSQQQQQQQQQQQKTLIRDLTGPPPAPPPGFPFQQWLPPTSQARAAAAEGGEVGGGVALPHAPSHPSLVGRKDYAAKQQLVPRGPRERAALRDIQNTVRQEAHVHQTTAQGAAPAAGAGGAGDGSTGDHAVQASRWPPVNAGGAFQKVVYPQPHPERKQQQQQQGTQAAWEQEQQRHEQQTVRQHEAQRRRQQQQQGQALEQQEPQHLSKRDHRYAPLRDQLAAVVNMQQQSRPRAAAPLPQGSEILREQGRHAAQPALPPNLLHEQQPDLAANKAAAAPTPGGKQRRRMAPA